MNWSSSLKAVLRHHAEQWAHQAAVMAYSSAGTPGTLLFPALGERHGNFFDDGWRCIEERPEWQQRLLKRHPQFRHLPPEHGPTARELDSSNSSDALLMNCFCYPGASQRFAVLLGASPVEAPPAFGVPGVVALQDGSTDTTELDMVLGDTIAEAKLTEADFTSRPREHVHRYAALEKVFDLAHLPATDTSFRGYQLIRNVLEADQGRKRLVVLIDARRPDLLQEWWAVHAAIRSAALRSRCSVRTWQELAAAAAPTHRQLLEAKYGF